MKHTRAIPSLLASLLWAVTQTTMAQTIDPQEASDSAYSDAIAAARTAYTQSETISATPNDPGAIQQSGDEQKDDDNTLAQMRRGPGRPFPRRAAYPRRASYPGMWAEPGNGRHAAIGAAIGFGLGVAVGAGGPDLPAGDKVKASLLFGAVGALIGTAVGYSVPSMHTWAGSRHRPRWPEEDELATASGVARAPEPSASRPPAAHPTPVEAEGGAQVSLPTP